MKFLDKFTGVSRVEEEERETSRSVKRTEGRGSQVEILSAHSYVIIRERVQEIVMVLSTEPVDATTRQTQPRSLVIWFESAAQIASNVFTIRYTGICRSISHDFAAPKIGRPLPLITFHHLQIKLQIYYVRVYNITPQYFVESLF